MERKTLAEQARKQLRSQVSAAATAAAQDWRHAGHWHLHHIALPDGPGDFTPYRAPDYAEHGLLPFGEWIEAMAGIFGRDHAQVIARRGLEAGQ